MALKAEMIDLGELDLPLMNEPVHPASNNMNMTTPKQWSAKIEEANAFIFVNRRI